MSRFHVGRGKAWHQQRTLAPKDQRTSPDGVLHPSASHMQRYMQLRLLESQGLVRDLRLEIPFPLIVENRPIKTRTGRTSHYRADFVYERLANGLWGRIIEDHKGYFDDASRFKIAVFEAIYNVAVHISKK